MGELLRARHWVLTPHRFVLVLLIKSTSDPTLENLGHTNLQQSCLNRCWYGEFELHKLPLRGWQLAQNRPIFGEPDAEIPATDYPVKRLARPDIVPIDGTLLQALTNPIELSPTFLYLRFAMTTFACPNCQHHIHLPEGVSQTALLQCPMCGHTTPASELTQSVGPTWIVVEPGDEGTPLVAAATTANAATAVNASPTEPDTSNASSGSTNESEYELTDPSLPKADRTRKQPLKQQDWSKHKPLTHDEYQKRKRKSSSPMTGIIQIVLGGALALPIAQLLIWHVLGKDPFELAPQTAAYAPWIVPYKFRPYTPSNDTKFVERSSPRRSSNAKSGSGIARDFDAELAASLADSEKKPAATPGNSPEDLKEEKKTAEKEAGSDDMKEKEVPSVPDVSIDSTTKDAPVSESEKLTLAIASTRKAIEEWTTVAKENSGERRKIANNFYSGLATCVEQFAKIEGEPSARIMKRELEKLFRDVGADPELLQLVRAGGFAKLSKATDTLTAGTGLALVATLEGDREANSWTIKARKSIIKETEETAANTQVREAVLNHDVLLGEDVSGDYLVLTTTESQADSESTDSKRDVIWFAMPIE